jgi:hypothetical protein
LQATFGLKWSNIFGVGIGAIFCMASEAVFVLGFGAIFCLSGNKQVTEEVKKYCQGKYCNE